MVMEGGYAKCVKYLFVLFNFLFLVLGICTLGFSLWGRISGTSVFEKDWFPNIDDQELRRHIATAFVWMIVASVILIGISVLGFIGGCKENRCLLVVYFLLVFIITIVFIAAVILFYQYPETTSKGLKYVLKKEKEDYEKNKTTVVENVDRMQISLKCCLWNETEARNRNIGTCFDPTVKNATSIPPSAKFHEKICSKELLVKIHEAIESQTLYVVLIVVVILIICVLSMALSMYICCRIKKESYQEMQ